MSSTPTTARRADAERNRERILAAARAAFAEPGADVSMAEVARRAGVGSATLYRNFAHRRALLEALYTDEIDAVCAAAGAGRDAAAQERLTAWLQAFYAYFSGKRLLAAELLAHSGPEDPVFTTGYARVTAAGRPLLDAAQQAGQARRDLDLAQVLDMVAAVARIEGDEAYRAPILRATLDALRAP